jgi:small subunit ribosomal protein S2
MTAEELKKKNQKKETTTKTKALAPNKEIEEMFRVGLHFGHFHPKKDPRMGPFIYGIRNNVDIIDLIETQKLIEKTLEYLKEKKKENALMLFVGTKISVRDLVKELAEKVGAPYVTQRWLGGTLTNFEVIKKRIDYLKEIMEKKERGELEKYTKKERLHIDREIERTERKLGGLRKLERLPDLLFVVDVEKEKHAIEEAKNKNIPIVGICDTDGNPNSVNYFIPANDDGIAPLKYIFKKVEKVLS